MLCKQIDGFPEYYITNAGDVYSRKTKKNSAGRIKKLKLSIDKDGYYTVCLYSNLGDSKRHMVHRLVAKAFIPNPGDKSQVNHKNGDKTDNHVENLEWCSAKENIRHSYDVLHRNGTWLGKKGKEHNCSKPILQIKDGFIINKFYSCLEAQRITGVCYSSIVKCCNKDPKRKTAGGFNWMYE